MNSFALFSSKATSAARALVPLGSHRQGGRFPKLPISLFPLEVPYLIKGCVTVMDFTRFPEDGLAVGSRYQTSLAARASPVLSAHPPSLQRRAAAPACDSSRPGMMACACLGFPKLWLSWPPWLGG